MEQELTNMESVETEPDRVEDVEDQETIDSQEATIDREEALEENRPPMYTREQMQEEINRIAQKERERGKRQTEAQYADYLQMADIIRQGAGIDVADPKQLNSMLLQMFEQNGVKIEPQKPALQQREQTILGEADARDDIELGIDYVLQRLDMYQASPPQDFREIARAKDLADFASKYFAAKELEKQGVNAAEVLGNKNFQAFAARYRADVPITEIYTDFKKVNGEMPRAPKSTGSVKGSGKTNDLFFTKDQVAAMSRDEIRKNFDAIERSRKKW